MIPTVRVWRGSWLAPAVALAAALVSPVAAYTPESPEVQEILGKAVKFLEQGREIRRGDGGYFLVGLALLKAGRDEGHPQVKLALDKALAMAQQVREQGIGSHVYNETLCLYFLCEMNPERYRDEISWVLDAILKRQRPNGCWGYNPHSHDDTSQTQYGVLALWAAHHHGFPVPGDAIERAANWLIRVQDPSGGWAYQARDPGTFERQTQGTVTHSMSAGGLSSVYICSHLLGFTASKQASQKEENGLPSAVQRVETEEEKRGRAAVIRPTVTNPQRLQSAQALGDAWFEQNLTYDVDRWTHYYMYAVERYKSFREFVEGKAVAKPAWYREGVEYLRKTQQSDGSWTAVLNFGSTPQIDTAFAILFLTRSSRSAIGRTVLDEGTLIGGRGLPRNLSNVQLVGGQVVTPQMVRDVDDLLALLTTTEDRDFDARHLPGGLTLDEDLTKRTSQLERLRQLVSDPDFQTRLAAVRTLGTAHDLDNVPVLIYALSDPDPRVMREARDGLRRISRRFHGFGLPADPTPQQLEAAVERWKNWYLSIRPDGAFIE